MTWTPGTDFYTCISGESYSVNQRRSQLSLSPRSPGWLYLPLYIHSRSIMCSSILLTLNLLLLRSSGHRKHCLVVANAFVFLTESLAWFQAGA